MKKLLTALTGIVLLAACTSSPSLRQMQLTGQAQGTTFAITYLDSAERQFEPAIDSIFKAVSRSVNIYDSTSLISRINRGSDSLPLDDIFLDLWQRSRQIAQATDGFFDPTVGPLVQFWGFGPSGKRIADSNLVDSVKRRTGIQKIRLNGGRLFFPGPGFYLDFNAIAQGYTVDLIANYLDQAGIKHYLVELGGEVRARGSNLEGDTWRLGIDKPSEELDPKNRLQAVVAVQNEALVTSGNYRKFWIDSASGIKYAHTINPRTGYPARNQLLSVSLLAPDATIADAYATAFMAMGLPKTLKLLEQKPELKAYLIASDRYGKWQIITRNGFEKQVLNTLD